MDLVREFRRLIAMKRNNQSYVLKEAMKVGTRRAVMGSGRQVPGKVCWLYHRVQAHGYQWLIDLANRRVPNSRPP